MLIVREAATSFRGRQWTPSVELNGRGKQVCSVLRFQMFIPALRLWVNWALLELAGKISAHVRCGLFSPPGAE